MIYNVHNAVHAEQSNDFVRFYQWFRELSHLKLDSLHLSCVLTLSLQIQMTQAAIFHIPALFCRCQLPRLSGSTFTEESRLKQCLAFI